MPDDAYGRIERWQRDFLKRHANGDLQYYADAASGLNIALQELDRERWGRTSPGVWSEYQSGKKRPTDVSLPSESVEKRHHREGLTSCWAEGDTSPA